MKRLVILGLTVLFFILFLDKCTSMNVLSTFKESGLKDLPSLKDDVRSRNYEIKRISKEAYANITYDPVGNYFLIIDNFTIRKLDAAGNEVFQLENSQMYLPRFTSYVFDSTGVYDFSSQKIEKQLFNRVLNLDQSLDKEEWQKTFDDLYQHADVVLFGGYTDLYHEDDPIFLRINGEWVLLITTPQETRLQEIEYRAGIRFEGYPAKHNHLSLLKDTQTQAYSDFEGTSDRYLQTYQDITLKEKQVAYPTDRNIKILSYEKQRVYSELAYTPIPIAWTCEVGNSLTIGGEELKFRCGGIKKLGLFNDVDTFLRWYSVPREFLPRTHVSFLKYSFPSNEQASENNGLYLVRKVG
ncbi:hypothetical protein FHS90_002161 [Rufibacter quisquiliarum]|uniref:Uncharacterized protein n=2 Tax=Rufibacter quisquiliarum TaxID=1549639 RepID=A0A839GSQ1_9BACT|nr:hypothetical protein [Rufibacter quisquiliarum]